MKRVVDLSINKPQNKKPQYFEQPDNCEHFKGLSKDYAHPIFWIIFGLTHPPIGDFFSIVTQDSTI